MVNESDVAFYSLFVLLCSASVLYLKKRKNKRLRRYKIRPLNRQKRLFGHFHTIVSFMKKSDHEQFFKYTRMTPRMFDHLLQLVSPLLQRDQRKNPISPEERLLITLHYLSEGCSMQQLAWDFCMGKTTVHCIVKEVTDVLWNVLSPIYLKPPTEEDFRNVARSFYKRWNMPNCIGALDGKHCVIQAPGGSGSDYFNYKKCFSVVLMATCDAFYRFTLVDIGAAGSNHDGHVFRESGFGSAILQRHESTLRLPPNMPLPNTNSELPYFFVADQAFPLHDHIMRPYPGENLGAKKSIFNYRLSRARRTIENTFGILAQRWRILRRPIIADVDNCVRFIKAACVLHNYVQVSEQEIPPMERRYCPTGFADYVDAEGRVHDGQWREEVALRSVGRLGANNASNRVKHYRDTLANYFVSDVGSVWWQFEHINRGALPHNN